VALSTLSALKQNPRLPCGSKSITRTLKPLLKRVRATALDVVVFPTPPFWLETAMILAIKQCPPLEIYLQNIIVFFKSLYYSPVNIIAKFWIISNIGQNYYKNHNRGLIFAN
jgi:hypothetical protein